MAFPDRGPPPSLLGYYRLLAPSAAVRVSPLCLGTMNFGDAWKGFMGECDKQTTFEILDAFYKAGGNFLDTSNNYQGEESETWLGEWMALRKTRDEMVIATKFTSAYPGSQRSVGIRANYQGSHRKSLRLSVEASLRKLQSDYIDLIYVHWWDFTTSISELMHGLHQLVLTGKVLYLGASDTPAWIVAKANEYARCHSLTPFSVYQGLWSAVDRDFERDIIQMCEAEGMGIAPWGSVGRGLFKSEADFEKKDGRRMGEQSPAIKAVVKVLDQIAKKHHTIMTSVAIAYVMHKSPHVTPIVGCRTLEHLEGNIAALGIELSEADIEQIEGAVPFDPGFPLKFLFEYGGKNKWSTNLTGKDIPLVSTAAQLDLPLKAQPPKPHTS